MSHAFQTFFLPIRNPPPPPEKGKTENGKEK
jgi:hypothetical protein